MNQLIAEWKRLGLTYEGAYGYLETIILEEDLRKKFILVRKGTINDRVYFIKSGLIRTYAPGEKEVTSWILGANHFAIVTGSFFLREPSEEIMETLEPTTVLSITYDQMNDTARRYPEFKEHIIKINDNYRALGHKIRIELAKRDPMERYLWLHENYPGIIERVTQPVLWSYLGITKNTLASIRYRLAKGIKK